MKNFLLLFIAVTVFAARPAGAVTINKAAPVATQASSGGAETLGSLVPSVLGLISNVKQITAQQQALTEECIPTSQEINFVNDTMKEWAKTGASTAADMRRALGREPCLSSKGYQQAVELAAGTDDIKICYEYFDGEGNKGTVWQDFPKAAKATYCSDGTRSCSEASKKTMSDIYEIFNLIDFSDKDYSKSEMTMATKLLAKIENCSSAKLSARKRALWSEFLMTTVSGVGQKTNTGDIMQAVGGMGSSGTAAMLQSIGSMATQFMSR